MKTKIKITFSIIILVLIILFSSFPISSLVLFSVNQGVSQDDDVFDQNEPIDNQDQVKIDLSNNIRNCPGFKLQFNSFDSEHMQLSLYPSDFKQTVVEIDGQVFSQIEINGTGHTRKVGKPMLPSLSLFLAVPVKDVTVNAEVVSSQLLSINTILPVQPPQVDSPEISKEMKESFQIDTNMYNSNIFYPDELIEIVETGTFRDVNFIKIQVYPIQYNAKANEMTVVDTISINLVWNYNQNPSCGISPKQSIGFQDIYGSVFVNWDIFSYTFLNSDFSNTRSAYDEAPMFGPLGPDGCEYLIITNSTFISAAEKLKAWKNERGIITKVVDTKETGNTTTSIKLYLQDAYDNWTLRPSYVLLMGDAEYIPTNYENMHPYEGSLTGTDLWYATLNGSDYYPDVYLGRMPVDTAEQAEDMVQRSINYEKDPPTKASYYTNMSVAAYFQDDNKDNYSDRRFVLTSEEVRDFMVSSGKNVERIYYAKSSVNPTNYNDGSFSNGSAIPSELLRMNGFEWNGSSTNISNAINNGIFILNHRDHGARWGWGDPYYTTTHISSLKNGDLQPIVFSINCRTGWFDHETDGYSSTTTESFCEQFIRKKNGGAVCVFGASRVSYSGYNDFLVRGFYDAIYPTFDTSYGNDSIAYYRMGEILNYGNAYMASTWGSWRLQFEIMHMFGDPTLELWTSQPTTLSASHEKIVPIGTTNISVNVSEDDALVCLVHNGEIIGRQTSSGGQVDIPILPLMNGTVTVTVSKHDRIPYQGKISVFVDNTPETGTTGDTFTINIDALESIDNASSYVNWMHAGLSGNTSFIDLGNDWQAPITLDHSLENLTYTVYVKDTPEDRNISELESVNVIDNDLPSFSDNTANTGTTGDPIEFNISSSDNIDVSAVYVNWAHGALFGNESLIETDNYWLAPTTLDHDLEDLEYVIYALDTSNNCNISEILKMGITDNDLPTCIDNSLALGTTGDPFNFNISGFDNIEVTSIYVNWTHGLISGNISLSRKNGYWSAPIILDNNLENLTYIAYINDTSNCIFSELHSVNVTDNDMPSVTDNSPNSGTTGDKFTFKIDTSDNIDVLAVKINWSHGTLSGTVFPTKKGSYWQGDITLDDSLDDLAYTIYVNDTSNNLNTSSVQVVSITDNDLPIFSDYSPNSGTTGDPFNFQLIMDDNIAVHDVTVEYWYGTSVHTNTTMIKDWMYKLTIKLPSLSIDSLYYLFHANDSFGNWNQTKVKEIPISDNDRPTFDNDTTLTYGYTGDSFIFSVVAKDNIGMQNITVQYWFGAGLHTNAPMLGPGPYELSIIIPLNSTSKLHYMFHAQDIFGSTNDSSIKEVEIFDNKKPTFGDDTTPKFGTTGDEIIFTIVVNDNLDIKNAIVEYWFGSGTRINSTMLGPSPYYLSIITPKKSLETLSYRFLATDSADNLRVTAIKEVSIIDNDPPKFETDNIPQSGTTGDDFTFTISVEDNIGTKNVTISYWFGSGLHINETLSGTGPYELTFILPATSTETMHYMLSAYDNAGNVEETLVTDVLIIDNDDPIFGLDTTPDSGTTDDQFIFDVAVNDNIDLKHVTVEYRFGLDSEASKSTTMVLGDSYTLSITIPSDSIKPLNYRFQAEDTSANLNSTIFNSITIQDNDNPVADPGKDTTIQAGDEVHLDGSSSHDNIGVVNYTWTINSNSHITVLNGIDQLIKLTTLGNYSVTLTVLDEAGNSDIEIMYVLVTEKTGDVPRVVVTFGPVQNEAGEALADAKVTIEWNGYEDIAFTDSNGMAIFKLPETAIGEELEMTISKEGYDSIKASTTLDNDLTLGVEPTNLQRSKSEAGNDYLWYILLIIFVLVIIITIFGITQKRTSGSGKVKESEKINVITEAPEDYGGELGGGETYPQSSQIASEDNETDNWDNDNEWDNGSAEAVEEDDYSDSDISWDDENGYDYDNDYSGDAFEDMDDVEDEDKNDIDPDPEITWDDDDVTEYNGEADLEN